MSAFIRLAWISGAVSICIFLAGCGSSGPKTYSVTGKLTINGTPAKKVQITFAPSDGSDNPPASGTTDDSGTYRLYSGVEGKEGAMPGTYKVVLRSLEADGANYMQSDQSSGNTAPGTPGGGGAIPKKYATAATSDKEVTVKEESNTIDIDIAAESE